MGFMNKLNKMKSFLFDEEEVEEKPSKKQPKKLVKKQVSKPQKIDIDEEFEKTQEIESLYIEDLPEEKPVVPEVKSRTIKNEAGFKFPEFNDDDFAIAKVKPEPIVSVSPVIKEEPKPILYQGSKRKEETKKFKPSPIISPVYGLLDESGNKIKKDDSKPDAKAKHKEDMTFDEVRRKAYGEVKLDDYEDTLKALKTKTIEEAEMEMDNKTKELSRAKEKSKKKSEDIDKSLKKEKQDDMILPNINFKEIDVDKERLGKKENYIKKETVNDDEDDDEETKEQDLFNLIDSMYQGKEKEEE